MRTGQEDIRQPGFRPPDRLRYLWLFLVSGDHGTAHARIVLEPVSDSALVFDLELRLVHSELLDQTLVYGFGAGLA